MVNQEEKKYQDFINKFKRSVAELERDFSELSQNNKPRAATELIEFVGRQTVLKMAASVLSGQNKASR